MSVTCLVGTGLWGLQNVSPAVSFLGLVHPVSSLLITFYVVLRLPSRQQLETVSCFSQLDRVFSSPSLSVLFSLFQLRTQSEPVSLTSFTFLTVLFICVWHVYMCLPVGQERWAPGPWSWSHRRVSAGPELTSAPLSISPTLFCL